MVFSIKLALFRRVTMIYKRYLVMFGPKGSYLRDDSYQEDGKKYLSMGEDEQEEVIPKESLSLRTWWRRWLKIK